MASEKVQILSDLQNILKVARANSAFVDVGTLVGLFWGESNVNSEAFSGAVDAIVAAPAEDSLLRYDGETLKFLDSATGTIEYAVLQIGATPT